MLRPGFEPGSRDRESLMLGRTTLPEQIWSIGSAPLEMANKAFSKHCVGPNQMSCSDIILRVVVSFSMSE